MSKLKQKEKRESNLIKYYKKHVRHVGVRRARESGQKQYLKWNGWAFSKTYKRQPKNRSYSSTNIANVRNGYIIAKLSKYKNRM